MSYCNELLSYCRKIVTSNFYFQYQTQPKYIFTIFWKLIVYLIFLGVSVVSKEVNRLADTTISCIVTDISEPVNITWSGYHGDEQHTADPGTLNSNSQTSTLHVTSVQSDHTYTCTVSSVQNPISPVASRDVNINVFSELPNS